MIKFNVQKAKDALVNSTVLIVDDELINRTIASEALAEQSKVLTAESAEQALQICHETPPDIILLDVIMPGMSGLELCEKLKQDEQTQHIPIIFVTGVAGLEEQEKCWNAGAVDFVTKPFVAATLRNRVKAHLALKIQTDLLRKLTYLDGLTGLYNRHMLDETIESTLREVHRSLEPCALVLLDIDWFKLFNDGNGHLEGDNCLSSVADILKKRLHRPNDMPFRFGGEEFLCVLPKTDEQGARTVIQDIFNQLESQNIEHANSPLGRVTLSAGATIVMPKDSELDFTVLLERADQALYQAKLDGRNRFYFN